MPPSGLYGFGPFAFDARSRQLSCDGREVVLGSREAALLNELITQAGVILSKDALVLAVWGDIAVTDNSLERLVSAVRSLLRQHDAGVYIENVPRRGYRFSAEIRPLSRRQSDDELAALMAPYRAWIEGRAALESLDRGKIAGARVVFEHVLATSPDQAAAHLGLANACVMQFETTRGDAVPDEAALVVAATHAAEACRLAPTLGESWATLGFVLSRTGDRLNALAAAKRAVELEPDNWRHRFRLSSIAWGEERLREARRTLALLPGFPLAHFLCATVLVARRAFDDAQRELRAGTAAAAGATEPMFTGVALHWLSGLVALSQGDEGAAGRAFEEECALEHTGHLYARECTASAWYARGALALRRRDKAGAVTAFAETQSRVPRHPMAVVGTAIAMGMSLPAFQAAAAAAVPTGLSDVDRAIARAAFIAWLPSGERREALADAAAAVDAALVAAEPGPVGWLLPVEPLLSVGDAPEIWAPVLARLAYRSA